MAFAFPQIRHHALVGFVDAHHQRVNGVFLHKNLLYSLSGRESGHSAWHRAKSIAPGVNAPAFCLAMTAAVRPPVAIYTVFEKKNPDSSF
jgi:hypothetical protein